MGVCTMAYLMETWINVWAYPLNIAGRPLFSWPAFIIPAYEWTILFAGLSAAFGMLAMNGLPQLYHPLFNAPNFRNGATTDKFFLCLEATDPKFSLGGETRAFLEAVPRDLVVEVESLMQSVWQSTKDLQEAGFPALSRCHLAVAALGHRRLPAGHAQPAEVLPAARSDFYADGRSVAAAGREHRGPQPAASGQLLLHRNSVTAKKAMGTCPSR